MDRYTVTALSLQVGENELERRFVWYQPKRFNGARVQIARLHDYERDCGFTASNSTVTVGAVCEIYNNSTSASCKVRVGGLTPGEAYIYRVGCDTEYDTENYTFSILADAANEQSFFLVADMHINVYRRCPERDTTYINRNWEYLLSRAMQFDNGCKPTFLLSVGDNISVCNLNDYAYPEKNTPAGAMEYSEAETAEFLAPKIMKEIAFATVLGNHDSALISNEDNYGYGSIAGYHYDLPNDDGYSGHFLNNSSGNFYFPSGELLVVGITAPCDIAPNNERSCSFEVNRAFIEKAVAAHPDAKWRILLNHVPEYSYISYYGAESERFRSTFSGLIDSLGFDVFFSGHQHAFSRTHALNGATSISTENTVCESDENGYKIETLTRPSGVIHYNIPSAHDHSFYARPYPDAPEKFFGAYGITTNAFEGMKVKYPDEAEKFKGVLYSSPMYTYISMKKGEMRIMTVRSDKNEAVDTLIIKK